MKRIQAATDSRTPRDKPINTPILLHRVNGVYFERANVKEAEAAVDLSAELLDGEEPPSIGVACFNLTQKEAIHEALAARVGKELILLADMKRQSDVKGKTHSKGCL